VLLVREAESGLWSLPGGWADACESAAEGVTREVREETGYEVKGLVLAAVYDRAKHAHHPPFAFHVYKLFFVGSIGNDANAGVQDPGIVEHAFFDLAAMPPLCRSRVLLSQIERCYAHLQDASLPTYVD
jgi:ADP-ribose pyrophosphatase YjhB (NUDIX family)